MLYELLNTFCGSYRARPTDHGTCSMEAELCSTETARGSTMRPRGHMTYLVITKHVSWPSQLYVMYGMAVMV